MQGGIRWQRDVEVNESGDDLLAGHVHHPRTIRDRHTSSIVHLDDQRSLDHDRLVRERRRPSPVHDRGIPQHERTRFVRR